MPLEADHRLSGWDSAADMATRIGSTCSRACAAALKDAGRLYSQIASMAKCVATDAAVGHHRAQVLGGYG